MDGQNYSHNNWFISPRVESSSLVFDTISGTLAALDGRDEMDGVRPVLYLSSNVKITDGTGESTNPYKLGL